MKKIAMFLVLATTVAMFFSCESGYTDMKGKVISYVSADWTLSGMYKCEAVSPNGDTLRVLMTEADFLNNPLPISGTIKISNQDGADYFVSDKPYDQRKISATALRLNKKPIMMSGLYECWISVPSGDEILAYVKETVYLQNTMPLKGYVSMVPAGGSKYFYLQTDTTTAAAKK